MLEQAVAEALLNDRRIVAEHARDKPHARFEQNHRRSFAASQHGFADRNFLHAARFDDTFVQALEAAAKEDDARSGSPFLRHRLIELFAARREVDERAEYNGATWDVNRDQRRTGFSLSSFGRDRLKPVLFG